MSNMLRVPATALARKGLGYLTAEAQERPVTITVHGKPVAVTVSAREHDEQRRRLADLEQRIVDQLAEIVATRSAKVPLSEARERLLAAG